MRKITNLVTAIVSIAVLATSSLAPAYAGSKKLKEKTVVAYAFTHQTKRVHTKCFPKALRKILAKVKKKYGKAPVVSSGYRSKKHNRRVGGARRSMHVSCKAADIRVPGVGKHALAKYLRSIRGVGGVGTYCGRGIVHVDVGVRRDWHYRCRKRRA